MQKLRIRSTLTQSADRIRDLRLAARVRKIDNKKSISRGELYKGDCVSRCGNHLGIENVGGGGRVDLTLCNAQLEYRQ